MDACCGSTIPGDNVWERRLLTSAGPHASPSSRRNRHSQPLRPSGLNLVVSDIARAGNPQEGLEAISAIRAVAPSTPILFYVGACLSPTPPADTQGIADEPTEWLHLVLNQLERHRILRRLTVPSGRRAKPVSQSRASRLSRRRRRTDAEQASAPKRAVGWRGAGAHRRRRPPGGTGTGIFPARRGP